jgi:hypothetical protein
VADEGTRGEVEENGVAHLAEDDADHPGEASKFASVEGDDEDGEEPSGDFTEAMAVRRNYPHVGSGELFLLIADVRCPQSGEVASNEKAALGEPAGVDPEEATGDGRPANVIEGGDHLEPEEGTGQKGLLDDVLESGERTGEAEAEVEDEVPHFEPEPEVAVEASAHALVNEKENGGDADEFATSPIAPEAEAAVEPEEPEAEADVEPEAVAAVEPEAEADVEPEAEAAVAPPPVPVLANTVHEEEEEEAERPQQLAGHVTANVALGDEKEEEDNDDDDDGVPPVPEVMAGLFPPGFPVLHLP